MKSSYLYTLVKSIEQRVKVVITTEGWYTKYQNFKFARYLAKLLANNRSTF